MKSTYDHVTFGEARMLKLWWDYSIKTTPQVKHNKPDIVLWIPSSMKCFIIDVCVPLYENIHTQEKEKNDKYTQLKVALLRLYPSYEYNIVPIVLGAMIGYIIASGKSGDFGLN